MTSHPITDAELARMDRELTDATERDGELYLTTDAPKDMLRLLAELRQVRSALAVAEGLEDGDIPVLDYSEPVTQADIREIAKEIAADTSPSRNWWERKLYATVVSLRARLFEIRDERDRLRAENTAQAAKLAAAEAGLEKAREDNGRTCYETVFWYDGEYEGECERPKYHTGPHFDGLSWWDDDRAEVEAPTDLGLDQEGTPS